MFFLKWILEWGSLPMLAVLAAIFVWRGLLREVPWFFCYIVIIFSGGVIRLVASLRLTMPEYSYVYWVSNLIGSAFAIVAIYEIFVRRLFVNFHKIRFYRYLFPLAGIAVTLLTALTAWSSHDPATFGVPDRTLGFVRVALLGFCVVLMLLMGRNWTRYEMGITFGFGILAGVSFFTSVVSLHSRYKLPDAITWYLLVVPWDITCLIWLVAFGGKKRDDKKGDQHQSLNPEMLMEARKWEGTLKKWLAPKRR